MPTSLIHQLTYDVADIVSLFVLTTVTILIGQFIRRTPLLTCSCLAGWMVYMVKIFAFILLEAPIVVSYLSFFTPTSTCFVWLGVAVAAWVVFGNYQVKCPLVLGNKRLSQDFRQAIRNNFLVPVGPDRDGCFGALRPLGYNVLRQRPLESFYAQNNGAPQRLYAMNVRDQKDQFNLENLPRYFMAPGVHQAQNLPNPNFENHHVRFAGPHHAQPIVNLAAQQNIRGQNLHFAAPVQQNVRNAYSSQPPLGVQKPKAVNPRNPRRRVQQKQNPLQEYPCAPACVDPPQQTIKVELQTCQPSQPCSLPVQDLPLNPVPQQIAPLAVQPSAQPIRSTLPIVDCPIPPVQQVAPQQESALATFQVTPAKVPNPDGTLSKQ